MPLSSPPRWCSWDLFRSLKVCTDAKEEWGAESNGKLPHLFIRGKTVILIPEIVVEDLSLGRTVALVSEFAAKDLNLGRTHWWDIYIYIYHYNHQNVLPKGRSITASSGTKAAVLADLPPQTQEPRLQFCSKAGLPLLTQEPKLQFCPRAGLPLQTQEPRLQFCTKADLPLQTQEP